MSKICHSRHVSDPTPSVSQVWPGHDLLQAGEVHPGGGPLPQGAGHQPVQLCAAVSHWRGRWMVVCHIGVVGGWLCVTLAW